MAKTALVTGASAGIGWYTAIRLKKEGFTVYGAARTMDKLNELEKYGVNPIHLDVSDENSMKECVDAILKKEGSIDILVNNAAYACAGAIEEVPISEAEQQFNVNVFGAARMIQLVLPKMRENRYGKIVNISSMGGIVWTPFIGWYHASKFALEGLSDCLRVEVKNFGIDVIVIEPGAVKTEFGNVTMTAVIAKSQDTPYEDAANKYANSFKTRTNNRLTDPHVIADCIAEAVTSPKPKTRYLLGMGAKPGVFIRKVFGDRFFDNQNSIWVPHHCV